MAAGSEAASPRLRDCRDGAGSCPEPLRGSSHLSSTFQPSGTMQHAQGLPAKLCCSRPSPSVWKAPQAEAEHFGEEEVRAEHAGFWGEGCARS